MMSTPGKKGTEGLLPVVLFCTGDDAGKAQQIEMLCGQFGYKTRLLGAADADIPVGKLAGMPGKAVKAVHENTADMRTKAPGDYRQPEIMIFSGISSEALDMFLGAWRMAGIAPVPLKAVLTPYNYTWSLYQLTQELIREHVAMMMERRK